MAASKRFKTKYPGVFYREAERIGGSGVERVYYIVFKKNGRVIEEKVGRQYADDMTPARASGLRAERVEGKRQSQKEIKDAIAAKRQAEANKPTIALLWAKYSSLRTQNKGLSVDANRYEKHLQPLFASKLPEEITTSEIDDLRVRLLKGKYSPQTVKHILCLLKRIITFGVNKGLCPAPDPAKLYFEMPTVDNQKTEFLTPEQLQRYLAVLDEEADQNAAAFLRLALVTGMRKGALIGLKWSDVNFTEGFIVLRGEEAKKGKTEIIPLTDAARSVLEAIHPRISEYVFPGRSGGKRVDFKKIALRVKEKAGLPDDFRPLHGLRHTYASMLASSGKVDIYTLQKLMTHSSPKMTQRYAHLADAALKRAANVINDCVDLESNIPHENTGK